ncbi:uncharacterized protein LOC112035440 [Quercus suber]|uniref:uncharacterized protein LOC112035440 n=1 Tax=Quercus suber TaxID=58331 RepID=UPI0032E03C92
MAFNLGFSSVAYLIHYYCRELSHIVLVHYWEKMLSVPEIEEVFGQKRVELSRTPIELNNSYWILKVVPWIGGRIISMMHLPSVMSKGKEKVGGTKQFRWLPPMHTTMLRLLAEEAAKGNKPSNTFKAGSFALVAKEISTQFGVECHPSYVENRLRTLRTMWTTIQTIRKKSGFS